MEILSANIINAKRDRNFGRIEAWVAMTVQYHPALPVRHLTVLASTKSKSGGVRTRILKDAKRVAVLMHRFDRWNATAADNVKIAA